MTSTVSSVALDCASNQSIFLAGESGPVWRVVEGVVHLDRDSGPIRQPVQLALPGDLIGAESLCGQPYQLSASAFTRCRLEPVRPDAAPEPLLQQALLQQLDRSQDMAQLRSGSVQQRLTHLLGLMGLDRAQIIGARLELVPSQPVRVISARAFAPLPKLLSLSAPFSTRQTAYVLPKGRSAAQELETLKPSIRAMFHVKHSLTDPDAGIIVKA